MSNKKIANAYNFFEIDICKQNVVFWGLNVLPKAIPLTETVLDLVRTLNLPPNEVVEIYDDETFSFFRKVYP